MLALAKEMKIRNLKLQREVIREELKNSFFEGEASYTYIGDVFSENVEYFQNVEGFDVRKIDNDDVRKEFGGYPLYVFSAANVELTEEEKVVAENYEPNKTELDPDTRERLKELEKMGESVQWSHFY